MNLYLYRQIKTNLLRDEVLYILADKLGLNKSVGYLKGIYLKG